MSTREQSKETDAFWDVVLSEQPHEIRMSFTEDFADEQCDGHVRKYVLSQAVLHLAGLPEASGVLSPVGAQVWHASAVLSCLPYNFTKIDSVLEIGSGAVGLSGLALAIEMGNNDKRIILSDVSEDGILDQLQRNTLSNVGKLIENEIPHASVIVRELDWRDKNAIDYLPRIDLVVGSELIYTHETAEACSSMLNSLLESNLTLKIVIVQVFDRPGWSDFLSMFPGKSISSVTPLPIALHDKASTIIGREALGTLSRDDYGLCVISNQKLRMIDLFYNMPDINADMWK